MRDLTPLLQPRSIAMIGASSDPMRGNGRTFRYLAQGGFGGSLYAINPRRQEVQGHRSWPSIEALPESVDTVIVAVPAADVPRALGECAKAGARAAIVFAGGFAESGKEGQRAQQELVDIARHADMLLLGPNTLGAYDARVRSYMTFSSMFEDGFATGGRLGMVTQSGGWGSQARQLAESRGMSIVQWVSTGNECDVNAGEVVNAMALDADIDVILLYLEGIRNGSEMLLGLEAARSRGKPVIAIKVGRTQAGRDAAASHTAALTGDGRVFDAMCRHFGIHRADSTEELLDVAYGALHAIRHDRMPQSPSTVILSPSGGFAVHMTDLLIDKGLHLPEPPKQVQRKILDRIPHASARNPVDVTGQVLNTLSDFGDVLSLLLEDATFDAADVFVGMAGAAPTLREQWLAALTEGAKRHPRKWLGVSILADPGMVARYEAAGYAVFEDTTRMVNVHAALVNAARAFRRPSTSVSTPPVGAQPAPDATEADARRFLRASGIPVPPEVICRRAEEAAEAASDIGFPVAVKVVSADIAHKTEVGGVALGLTDAQAVEQAVTSMAARVLLARPEAQIDGYLVTAMAPEGIDCMVGLHHDPAFGPVILFGAGGIMAEWLDDVSLRLAPVDTATALDMISETKISRLLQGWRGAAPGDVNALAQAIATLSTWGGIGTPLDIEINPLRVLPEGDGVLALDALLVRHSNTTGAP